MIVLAKAGLSFEKRKQNIATKIAEQCPCITRWSHTMIITSFPPLCRSPHFPHLQDFHFHATKVLELEHVIITVCTDDTGILFATKITNETATTLDTTNTTIISQYLLLTHAMC
jgi:hypothetical protein